MGSGGVFGTGLGESVQKAFYLPEAHTDMIAAVIGEEIGLVGIGILSSLYMLLGYAGFQIAQKAKDRYGRLLAAGLTAMIMIQATINLYAVMGMAPLTGVTLPFVSYGNSSLIVTLASVGLLLNVASGGTASALVRAPRARPESSARRQGRALRVVEGGGGSSSRPTAAPKRRAGSRAKGAASSSSGRTASSRGRGQASGAGGPSGSRSDRGGRDGRARGAGPRRRRRA